MARTAIYAHYPIVFRTGFIVSKIIHRFSQLAKPLTNLTKDKVVWGWGDAEQNIFLVLKAAMAAAPIVHLHDFEQQFIVIKNGSAVAIGAILEQDFGSASSQ